MARIFQWFILVALCTLVPGAALADDLAALRGQTIRMIVAHRAGNTTDTMARLFAATVEKLVPEAAVRIQNLDGSGGTLALNEIYGELVLFTLGFVNSGVVYSQATLDEKLAYDLTKFRWIGALAGSQRVLVVRKGVLELADPHKKQPSGKPARRRGHTTAKADNYMDGLLINDLTNIRLKMVTGFKTEQQDAMLLAGDADAGIVNL